MNDSMITIPHRVIMHNVAPQTPSDRLKGWPSWPDNCRSHKPGLHNVSAIRRLLCDAEIHDARRVGTQKVLHISEYSANGANLRDQFMNEKELEEYLDGGKWHSSDCKFRLFFASSDRGWRASTRSYMRRWWYRYSVPTDVAVTAASCPIATFKTFTEELAIPGSASSSRKVLHLWLGCHLNLPPLQRDEIYFCQNALLEELIQEHYISATFNPLVYIQYDILENDTTILALDWPPLYCTLRQACEHSFSTGITTDPFVFLVSHLGCLLTSLRRVYIVWTDRLRRYEIKIYDEEQNYSSILQKLSRDRQIYDYTVRTLDELGRSAGRMRDEHRRFADLKELPQDLFNFVNESFGSLESDIGILSREIELLSANVSRQTEILLGISQLQNGIRMRLIAEDNHHQANAAQAIAMEAKKDSEIMKTITVVTLVYLPGTFVCTLLSMGIFEWPSHSAGEVGGGLRVAKMGWLFLAIAVPLTIITCGIAWWRYSQHIEQAMTELKRQATRENVLGGRTGMADDACDGKMQIKHSVASQEAMVGSQTHPVVDKAPENLPKQTTVWRINPITLLSNLVSFIRQSRKFLPGGQQRTSPV